MKVGPGLGTAAESRRTTQPNYRMLLPSCSYNHLGLFGSKDLRIDINPQFGIHEFSCGYLHVQCWRVSPVVMYKPIV
jgi:hypothetical protein